MRENSSVPSSTAGVNANHAHLPDIGGAGMTEGDPGHVLPPWLSAVWLEVFHAHLRDPSTCEAASTSGS